MKRPLPNATDKRFLVFAGTGTDLIFNRGIDLPGFASFPLVNNPAAQPVLVQQMRELMAVAQGAGMGAILDTPTWMASRDRAAPLGYDTEALATINQAAVAMMRELRDASETNDVLLALCLGPARDPYTTLDPLDVETARSYHREQLGWVADAGLDLVNAYTFNQVQEAAGAALAADDLGLPIAVSLVVETDGRLHNGQSLEEALDEIDALTSAAPQYFMVNCAHPEHFSATLPDNPRLKGVVVNASRWSHAELDDATELDDGDPDELGKEVAKLIAEHPQLSVLGGCCGTDMRHLGRIAAEVTA